MNIGFVYDVLENVYATTGSERVIEELSTELFPADQANTLISALKEIGHRVTVIDGAKEFADNLPMLRTRLDFVFNEAKGMFGPDRKMIVPALCRIYGLPFLGSDAYTVMLARNKWHSLALVASSGIPTPKSALCDDIDEDNFHQWVHFPAIVKPNFESSSIGISDSSIVHDNFGLTRKIRECIEVYNQPALIQEFILGTEIQVSLVGGRNPVVLGVTEIRTEERPVVGHSFVRNEDWREGRVKITPYTDSDVLNRVIGLASKVYQAIGIRDYGRVDFRVTPAGQLLFIEAATHPHITPGSSFEISALSYGWHFSEMLQELLSIARLR